MKRRLRINRKAVYILALAMLIITSSCTRRDLVELPTSRLYINVDWTKFGAKSKTDYFYVLAYQRNSTTTKSNVSTFIEGDGGYISLPRGVFDIIIYTYDYEAIVVRETDRFFSALATTPPSDPERTFKDKLMNFDDFLILNQTDEVFYTGIYEGVSIEEVGIEYEISIAPDDVVKNYEIHVEVENAGGLVGVYGIVSGLSGSYMLGEHKPADDPVSIHGEMRLKDGELIMHLSTFGKIKDRSSSFIVRTILNNGETLFFEFDITDDMDDLPDGGLIIIDDIIELPYIGGTGGGMGASVDDWGEEEGVDIEM